MLFFSLLNKKIKCLQISWASGIRSVTLRRMSTQKFAIASGPYFLIFLRISIFFEFSARNFWNFPTWKYEFYSHFCERTTIRCCQRALEKLQSVGKMQITQFLDFLGNIENLKFWHICQNGEFVTPGESLRILNYGLFWQNKPRNRKQIRLFIPQ